MAAAREDVKGEVYNLGAPGTVTLSELADMLVALHGGTYETREFPAERKSIDIGDYYADFTKIQMHLGWAPKISLKDGLAKTIAFYQKNLKHYL